jgi:hypothetical protein
MDYQAELEKYKDAPEEQRQELAKLAELQKDISAGETASDFVRHPFFKLFENKMNEMINDSKNKILEIESLEDLKAHKAAITAISELKKWINSHVVKGRFAAAAIDQYEKDTEEMNFRIQAAIDESNQK